MTSLSPLALSSLKARPLLTSCTFSLKHIPEEQNMTVERTNAKYFVNTEECMF